MPVVARAPRSGSCKANVADDADCRRIVAAASDWGRLDALINLRRSLFSPLPPSGAYFDANRLPQTGLDNRERGPRDVNKR